KEPERKSNEEKPQTPSPQESEGEPEDVDTILKKISEKEEEPAEKLSLVQRLVGVFYQPLRVFRYLRSKPDFLAPLFISILMSVVMSWQVYDIALDDNLQRIQQSERFSQEQKNNMIDQIEAGRYGMRRYLSIFAFPTIGTVLWMLVLAFIFLFIGNVLLGGKSTFKQLFSTLSYSWLIFSVVGSLISLPLILQQQTLKIHLSLAAFMPQSAEKTPLFQLIDSFDIFTVWFIIVFGLGFATIYRFSSKKGIIAVLITWLVGVLIFKVVLGTFATRFFGA
ncbi:YIP1 family protein, partial [Candidatus Saccharibacteria bacterium]|nr:YIP1 family protein [Candidatus Saccharibacteria bacterium]